jgi:hypothetical protein
LYRLYSRKYRIYRIYKIYSSIRRAVIYKSTVFNILQRMCNKIGRIAVGYKTVVQQDRTTTR